MRTDYLNPNLYNKLYAVLQYENALAIRVSLETGLRIDDVLSLRVESLVGRTLYGVAEKTGKPFRKVISTETAKRLKALQEFGWFFPHRTDPTKHRTRQTVWKDVKKAVALLKLGGNIAPHSARKTYSVELFKDSGLEAVQKELQHDNITTTVLYALSDSLNKSEREEPNEELLDRLAEKIAKKVAQLLKS